MVSGEWQRPAWGVTCRLTLPLDLFRTERSGGSRGAGSAIWPRLGNLGGVVQAGGRAGRRACGRCQHSSIRAVCEQMFCGALAPTGLRREDVSISGWRLSGGGEVGSDLESAACQFLSPKAL